MKSLKLLVIAGILISSNLFAFLGFGLQMGQSMFSVDESNPATGSQYITLTNGSFDGAYAFGGYFYFDALPFVDVEFGLNVRGNTYDISFSNDFGPMDPLEFAWLSTDMYLTLRKSIFSASVPILGGVKIHAGGGFNRHLTTPIASLDMITDLLGGGPDALLTGNTDNLADNIEDFLTDADNYDEATGIHIQGGIQFKLLVLDTFLNYRYTIADDVVPDGGGFGSLNFRIGFGI